MCKSRTSSTSHSISSSSSTGGGSSCTQSGKWFFQCGSRSDTWNTGWMCICIGSSSQKVSLLSLITSRILKGPRHLISSFEEGCMVVMCLRESQTRSPGLKGWSFLVSHVVVLLVFGLGTFEFFFCWSWIAWYFSMSSSMEGFGFASGSMDITWRVQWGCRL